MIDKSAKIQADPASASLWSKVQQWPHRLSEKPVFASMFGMFGFFDAMFTLKDILQGATTLLSMLS